MGLLHVSTALVQADTALGVARLLERYIILRLINFIVPQFAIDQASRRQLTSSIEACIFS